MFKQAPRLGAAVVAAGALAVTPQAAQAMTVRLGSPELVAKMAITVPVTVSCSPFDASLVQYASSVSVTAQQAAGKDIAYGTGSASGGFGPDHLLFACDSSEHTVTVTVLADTAGVPFHGGKAILSASGQAQAGFPCYPGATDCFFGNAGQIGSTGAVETKL